MEKILENVARSSDRTPGFSSSIPLKERNMESAIKSISKNFKQSFIRHKLLQNKPFNFLSVVELLVLVGHFYKVLTFNAYVELDCYDNNLTADSAIALRIAYKFFVVDESYQMQFNVFRQKIYDHFKVNSTIESLTKFESTINLNNVIQSICMSRQLNDNRTLVILLHIDEIQIMFNYEKYWMRKGFTKRLLHRLALYMLDNKTFIQTFLSGTALQDVVKLKEPTSYNFSYINCPLLSMGACIEIVNYFAVRENVTNYQWTLDRSFIKILDDARGLPRAIEYILEEILERNLFKNHKNHPWNLTGFFIKIATRLDFSYNITTFVKEHKDLALTLLKNCLKSDSIERTHKVLKSDDNSLTYGELERDKHIILEDVDGKLFIAMPVYFIHLYNTTLNLADVILSETLISNQRSMEWQHWETFVAHFEMFKVNLLFASGKTTAKLNEIYPGAFGNEKTLSLKFKLKNLKGIAYLEHQFPSKYEGLRCRNTKVSHTWKDNIVFKNAASSEFGDSILRYVSEDSNGYFLCLQCKWIWGKDFQIPLKLPDFVGEHRKNLATLEKCDSEEIKKEKIITVLFTTRAIDPELTYDFSSAIPDNILLVCRDNFHQHFGRLFASRVDFELLSVNANYTCPDILTKIFSTEIKDSPEALMLKRPFHSPEDFKDRVAFNDGVTFDSDEGIKAKICRLSYVPFQKHQVSQIQELPAFERRVFPRLANEERINYPPTNLREIRFFDEFNVSLEVLKEFFEKWKGRPTLSILTSNSIYEGEDK
ncbi:4214_t:CDS:2, partial [Rhizophagus irregularis]